MRNLLEETLWCIKHYTDFKPDAVDYVQTDDGWCSWSQYITWADQIDYDEGYGCVEINLSLKIVFKNGTYLERHEYDGSEWFKYIPAIRKKEHRLVDVAQLREY